MVRIEAMIEQNSSLSSMVHCGLKNEDTAVNMTLVETDTASIKMITSTGFQRLNIAPSVY